MPIMSNTVCVPGQRICAWDDDHISGEGTYTRNGFIHSSLAGFLHKAPGEEKKTIVQVQTEMEQNVVPGVGSLVTAKVSSVNPRFCKCHIITVDGTSLRETFRGMIRKEDVRTTEKDKVELYKCFRPGDIIVAKVLSLGDAQSYVLTTAENELGVVIATSEAGASMIPISWNEMQCPKTMSRELRKVAKAQPQHIDLKR